MQAGVGALGTAAWTKVDVLTPYERITADIQIRGRLRETVNDAEPLFHLKNISAEPLMAGAVPLNGVPEGLFNKAFICGIRTVEPEPPPPDQVLERIRRYAMFQGSSFMVSGFAEFPKASAPEMHFEVLMKGRFFHLLEATVTIIGSDAKPWIQPEIYVNRDQMLGLFLG